MLFVILDTLWILLEINLDKILHNSLLSFILSTVHRVYLFINHPTRYYIVHRVCKGIKLCHKLKFSNPYIFSTWWCKPFILQCYIIWSNRIQSWKCLRSATYWGKIRIGAFFTDIFRGFLWEPFFWKPKQITVFYSPCSVYACIYIYCCRLYSPCSVYACIYILL